VASLPPDLQSPDIQQLLLAWANAALPPTHHVQALVDMRDGEALCRLVLAHRPNMAAVQAALAKQDPEQRLAAFFATVQNQLCVPNLLDSQVGGIANYSSSNTACKYILWKICKQRLSVRA
jgi:hypothetical protein